jgi:hypothetical protein
MNQTIAAGLRRWQRRAEGDGVCDFALKPVTVNRCGLAMLQDFDANWRMGIVKSDGKKATFRVKDDSQVAGLACMTLFDDSAVKEPGMPTLKSAFGGGSDMDGDAFIRRMRKLRQIECNAPVL